MNHHYATLPNLALLTLALGAAPLAAQSKQASYVNNWGNATAGCGIEMLAKASYLPTTRMLWTGRTGTVNTALSYAHGRGTVSLFGASREAMYAQVSAEAMDSQFVGTSYGIGWSSTDVARKSLKLRLGGFTVVSQSGAQDLFWNAGHDQDILHDTRLHLIDGWFPVTTEYTLGAGIGLNLGAITHLPSMQSAVMGSVNLRAYGDGSVAIGAPGWRCGLELRFDACRTTFGVNIGANPTSQAGQFTLLVESITLRFFVFAEALWQRIEDELFKYTAPALSSRTFPLF